MKTDVKTLYVKVWNFRHEIKDQWPTPGTRDSFRFAATEAAEALKEEDVIRMALATDMMRAMSTVEDQIFAPIDSKRHFRAASIKLGAALDAEIRLDAQYKRNRDLVPDADKIYDELADAAMMLLTALGPDQIIFKPAGVPKVQDLDTISRMVGEAYFAWQSRRMNLSRWAKLVVILVAIIGEYPGMDLEARLDGRLQGIRDKHFKVTPEAEAIPA